MKVLLVGAGATGLVYGHHLAKAGAQCTFFVKPHHAAALTEGVAMVRCGMRKPWHSERFEGYGIATTLEHVGSSRWDAVWLCISATALRHPSVEAVLAAAAGAAVVTTTPGMHDLPYLRSIVGPSRELAQIVTGYLAWTRPLPRETWQAPGCAYWFPPTSPSRLDGAESVVERSLRLLERGELPAVEQAGVAIWAQSASAVMMPMLLALEDARWDWSAFLRGPGLALGCRGAHEALSAVAMELGAEPPPWRALLQPALVSTALRAAPWVSPLDLQAFVAAHFTKVGDQTREMVRSYIEAARRHGTSHTALDALCALPRQPAAPMLAHSAPA
jgi:2-dehydropantoate 2-reductase